MYFTKIIFFKNNMVPPLNILKSDLKNVNNDIQGYPQRIKLQRRLYRICTEFMYMIPLDINQI